MRNLLLVAISFSILSCQPQAPEESKSPEFEKIDQLVAFQRSSFEVPGLAVGLIKEGKVIYAEGHGLQGLGTQQPLTRQSLFHMASVSKPFVATAIVQLVEQGKIDLEEKLTHYLPYFTMADERYKAITIQQMLNHTSGIPDVDDYEWNKPQYDDGAAERYARQHATIGLDFTPGERFSYSNAAFDILCDVIAKVSGMTFEDYTKKYIFEPVGMKNSTFFKPDVPENLATQPHIIGDSLKAVVSVVYPYNRRHAGSSTLHSNVEDMMRWAMVNLNKGEIEGKRIYNEASYDLLTTVTHQINDTRNVCLSWFTRNLRGHDIFYHSGGDTGYSTFFAFIPSKKSAVVLMANESSFWGTDAASMLLLNTFYGDSLRWEVPINYMLDDYILTEGIDKVKALYHEEATKTPREYMIEGGLIDDMGYHLLERGHHKKALEVFLFNTELEPEHAGWVDSVADAYAAMDSTQQAIAWYRQALKMNPEQDFSRKKLNALLNQ